MALAHMHTRGRSWQNTGLGMLLATRVLVAHHSRPSHSCPRNLGGALLPLWSWKRRQAASDPAVCDPPSTALPRRRVATRAQVFLTTTHIFIVMEYASGGELFEFVKRSNRLSEDAARFFFQQLISGVDYCHQQVRTFCQGSKGLNRQLVSGRGLLLSAGHECLEAQRAVTAC